MMPFRLSYLVTGLYLLTNVIQANSHLGHTIITTSVIFPLKEMSIAIRKERLYIISSTYPHRGISLSIIGKQTIQQDRVILPSMY